MSYLLHGSSQHTGMGWVDRVPRAGNLYIGGLYALYQTDLIESAGITHVLSVIDYDPLLRERFKHLQHFHIRAEDGPGENLLQHFQGAIEYMDAALNGVSEGGKAGDDEKGKEGGVFVHCAMGKSRSATLVVAYLMWKYGVSWEKGLEWLCEGRPVCDPNPGFKEQLKVWGKMLNVNCGDRVQNEEKRTNIYDEWEKQKFTGEWWEWEDRVREKKMKPLDKSNL